MSNDCVRTISSDGKSLVEICDASHGGLEITTTDIDDGGLISKEQLYLDGDSVSCTYCQPEDGPDCQKTCTLTANGLMDSHKVDEVKEKLIANK